MADDLLVGDILEPVVGYGRFRYETAGIRAFNVAVALIEAPEFIVETFSPMMSVGARLELFEVGGFAGVGIDGFVADGFEFGALL